MSILSPAEVRAMDSPQAVQAAVASEMVAVCRAAFGRDLRAVVLTGSLARGEGSAVRRDGGWQLLSDAEFIILLQDQAPLTADAQALAREAHSRLAELDIHCAISASLAHADYFASLQPHIFAYELRVCGQVVWGEPDALLLIPAFPVSALPKEDAWQMLSNRTIEFLEASAGDDAAQLSYRTIKLHLDLATSLLVFLGAYEPGYAARAARLREIANSRPSLGPIDLKELAQRVEVCTGWKLGEGAPADEGLARQFRSAAPRDAARVWRWELAQMTGMAENTPTRSLMRAWMRRQSYRRRLRGWLYAARHQGWLRSVRQWPRWMVRAAKASPRYWTYACAGELAGAIAERNENSGAENGLSAAECRRIAAQLPVDRAAGACADWQTLAREIAWNYHAFLEGTRS